MHLRLIGCSHHEASADDRARLAFDAPLAERFLTTLRAGAPGREAVLLSTCNRVELYVAAESLPLIPADAEMITAFADHCGIPAADVRSLLRTSTGDDVGRHLLSVTAGLSSLAPGERQIVGQVKEAYARAHRLGTVGPILHRLFQTAFRTARRVAAETLFGAGRVSFPSLAIGDLAANEFDGLVEKKTLLIGAGAMAEETLKYLASIGSQHITVLNRTPTRAKSLAKRWGCRTADWNALWPELANTDIVVCATGAMQPIVSRTGVEKNIAYSRQQRPLFAIDLAIPRNIEPCVGEIPGIRLVAMDDLKAVSERNLAARKRELPAAKAIVEEESLRFRAEISYRSIAPNVQLLKRRWSKEKDAEIARLLTSLPEFDRSSLRAIHDSYDRLLQKLLHPTLDSLSNESHNRDANKLFDAFTKLFQLDR